MPSFMAVILVAIKEMFMAMLFKVAWQAVAERFFTRLVLWGLKKLEAYSQNDVLDATINDIIASLEGKKLYVIDNEVKRPRE